MSLSRGRTLEVGDLGIDAEDLPPLDHGPIDLRAWFGSSRRALPMELEIGVGKGTFLVQHAPLTPGVNYIGVEYARTFWRYAADRCRRRGIDNVRLVRIEAGAFVRNYAPDRAFRQVHIYFPDPWPKKRHHKRRFVQEQNLRELHRALESGGQVRLATDHGGYFEWMLEHAQRVSDLFERLAFDSPESAGEGELVGTNFERKYRRERREFHAIVLRAKTTCS